MFSSDLQLYVLGEAKVELSSLKENNKTPLFKNVKPLASAIRLKPEGEFVWVEFDLQGEKANKLSSGVMARLREVIAELSHSNYKAAVFISRKPNIFIAGADIEEIKNIKLPA